MDAENAGVENWRVENTGGDCSKYGKPIVFWLDKMTVALSQHFFVPVWQLMYKNN